MAKFLFGDDPMAVQDAQRTVQTLCTSQQGLSEVVQAAGMSRPRGSGQAKKSCLGLRLRGETVA